MLSVRGPVPGGGSELSPAGRAERVPRGGALLAREGAALSPCPGAMEGSQAQDVIKAPRHRAEPEAGAESGTCSQFLTRGCGRGEQRAHEAHSEERASLQSAQACHRMWPKRLKCSRRLWLTQVTSAVECLVAITYVP